MANTTDRFADLRAIPLRRGLLLLGAGLLVAAGLVAAERIALAAEQARLGEALAALSHHAKLERLEPVSSRTLADGTSVALFELDRPQRGYDMLVLEVELRCSSVELAATTAQGVVLQSARDQRYLATSRSGSHLFVLTVYRAHVVEAERYAAALRFKPGCAQAGKIARLAARDRATWAGPPLADVFTREAGSWRANLGTGSRWVEREPEAQWVKQALSAR